MGRVSPYTASVVGVKAYDYGLNPYVHWVHVKPIYMYLDILKNKVEFGLPPKVHYVC